MKRKWLKQPTCSFHKSHVCSSEETAYRVAGYGGGWINFNLLTDSAIYPASTSLTDGSTVCALDWSNNHCSDYVL